MIIIGHPHVPFQVIHRIDSVEAIKNTPSNATVFIPFNRDNIELIQYCEANSVPAAIEVTTVGDALLSENLDAKYIVAQKALAAELQPIAENYLFDAKILAWCSSEEEMEEIAKIGVDGVLFPEAIRLLS